MADKRDKRIVTDMPNLVGWQDGFNAASNGDRTSRAEQMPDGQRQTYQENFRRGARDGAKSND